MTPVTNIEPTKKMGFLSLNYLHGKSDEDPELFLNKFELWCKYKNYTERMATNTFPLLLKDGAYLLFNSLDVYTKESMYRIIGQFKLRYFPKRLDL